VHRRRHGRRGYLREPSELADRLVSPLAASFHLLAADF
jgi:hypothetical protein